MASAGTPGAAHAMARFGGETISEICPGGQADALALLPVAALRVDVRVVDGLRSLGLDLVGQLVTTPRGPLAQRFGDGLLVRLD